MNNIEKLLGHPRFMSSRLYNKTPVGVIAGMAYTEFGGSLIFLEAMKSSFKKN
jgi:ATP-dependent Lon protease